jgi:proteasome lid subunit RPN8/RPN11
VAPGELTFPRAVLDRLHAHAREGHPHEVVGILAGRDGVVREIAAMVNERADSPRNRYLVSGLALMRAQQRLEAEGHEILGYYHSHPDHPARYSDFDRDHSLPNLSYVIVSVSSDRVDDTRSWRLREDRSAMDEEPVHVVPTLESK